MPAITIIFALQALWCASATVATADVEPRLAVIHGIGFVLNVVGFMLALTVPW